MNGLNSCPFCGKSDSVMYSNCKDLGDCQNWEECVIPGHIAVVCSFLSGGCGASGGYRKTAEEAADAWDQRADAKTEED